MSEPGADLVTRLRLLCDEDADRLRGLVCAVHGLAEALFSRAKDAGALEPAHLGLRHVLGEAEAAAVELDERLGEALELSRGARSG